MQNKLAKIEGTNFVYEFLYNSRNERIAIGKSVNAAEMTWRYDACNGPVCIAEFDESADVDTYFVRGSGIAQGIGDVIAEVNYDGTSEVIHYYLYNHRGDVVCVVNPGSTPNTTYRYDAYGRCYENYGSYTSRYTFSTKEYLPDANLYLYQYRVYDPQAGRWTQRDPIDYADSINLYQFCGNNPINAWDPFGLFWFDDVANWARDTGQKAKDYVADNTHWIAAGTINTAIDIAFGYATLPESIGHLGESSGTFAGNPTIENAAGVFINDVSVAAGVLATGMAGVPSAKAPLGKLKPSHIAKKTPTQIDRIAKAKGYKPKGPSPKTGKGAYTHPKTGKQGVLIHDDHAHLNNPNGKRMHYKGDTHIPIRSE